MDATDNHWFLSPLLHFKTPTNQCSLVTNAGGGNNRVVGGIYQFSVVTHSCDSGVTPVGCRDLFNVGVFFNGLHLPYVYRDFHENRKFSAVRKAISSIKGLEKADGFTTATLRGEIIVMSAVVRELTPITENKRHNC
jgi:hypothetical protein